MATVDNLVPNGQPYGAKRAARIYISQGKTAAARSRRAKALRHRKK